MGYLAGKRAYLSGAIEFGNPNDNWREGPRKVLREEFNIDLFDPFEDPKQQWVEKLHKAREECDYNEMARIAEKFVHKDLSIVDECRFVVAYLPHKVCTTGTHHEIINSVNLKKPVMIVCPQGKQFTPLWYYGFIPHEFMFGSWGSLYTYLYEVDAGLHKENKRWRRVYDLV
jgi:hypothetical protein